MEKKARLERDLFKINNALDALAKNPELADALTKVGIALQTRY